MIVIDNVIISDEIKNKHFVCHLEKCKGACCVQGVGGAPLNKEEAEILPKIYDQVKPYLTEEGVKTIEKVGLSNQEAGEENLATPLRPSDSACVYVNFGDDDTAYCGIEKAYLDGKITFQKPVSCHLYPVRVKEHATFTAVNYDEWEICSPACDFGKELGIPLYQFVKMPLIRRFGEEFYETLHATIQHLDNEEKQQ